MRVRTAVHDGFFTVAAEPPREDTMPSASMKSSTASLYFMVMSRSLLSIEVFDEAVLGRGAFEDRGWPPLRLALM